MALQKKPPVVTIMGHVDHGKTSLLDYIRKTKLAAKEFGEITQAIGAYQIGTGEKKITFIDTPGHEAFSKMRYRGASVADIVVLVVAADDGVMPQTKESIKIIKEAGVPFVVAINKIDLPGVSAEKIKAQLAESEVFVEGYGGNVVAVPISTKTGTGIDQLLEMILLTAEIEDLKTDLDGKLEAEVIESKADKFCGSVATVIVKNGILRKNDEICSQNICAKVKMLKNEWGKPTETAFPSDPVEVLGFVSVLPVGSVIVSKSEQAGQKTKETVAEERVVEEAKVVEGNRLKIILKTDVGGSREAILDCLPEKVEVVGGETGEIKESDILLAKTLKADVYGFNLLIPGNMQKLAEMEKVRVKSFRIIYDLLKDLEERIKKIQEPGANRTILGKAEILAVFEMKGEKIAGAKVTLGKINKTMPIFIQREEKVLGEGKIVSLREQKQNINEAVMGSEFGAAILPKLDFKKGDMLISFSLEQILKG